MHNLKAQSRNVANRLREMNTDAPRLSQDDVIRTEGGLIVFSGGWASYLFHSRFLLIILCDLKDRGDIFLRNVGYFQPMTCRYIIKFISVHNHRCEDRKSYKGDYWSASGSGSFTPDESALMLIEWDWIEPSLKQSFQESNPSLLSDRDFLTHARNLCPTRICLYTQNQVFARHGTFQ
jgi:hypothetical protein